MNARPESLGALKKAAYRSRTVKDEVRSNLQDRLARGETLFPGIIGYEDSVIPGIVHAVLARQNFILLGLRGQAKSRILRQLVDLLDDEVPVLAGSEVNDDPLRPISKYGRQLVQEHGDDAPIAWLPRDARFVEKLATPDVTIADLIGDVDPIRAARGGHLLSDELTIHYGLLPRANRGLFAVNELPDLAARIQVGLFNVLQEGDIQIKGFPVRLPLDVMLVFTANPEDYTARGKIITPLKDRIGAEIGTHYPESLELGMTITRQEAWLDRDGTGVDVPGVVTEVIERVAFLAREDKRVDQRSGVSQRLPISALENAVSSAERRALACGEPAAIPRISDVYAAMPAIVGKLELEYEGELVGATAIAAELIARAAAESFEVRAGESAEPALERIVAHFDEGGVLRMGDTAAADACLRGFRGVPGLVELVRHLELAPEGQPGHEVAACELVLEALVAERRISRSDDGGYRRGARRRPPRGGMGPGAGGGMGPATGGGPKSPGSGPLQA